MQLLLHLHPTSSSQVMSPADSTAVVALSVGHDHVSLSSEHHPHLSHPSVSHTRSLIVDISRFTSHQYLITTGRSLAEIGKMGCQLAKEICRLTATCELDGMADLVKTLLQVQLVCRQLFGHGAVLGVSC